MRNSDADKRLILNPDEPGEPRSSYQSDWTQEHATLLEAQAQFLRAVAHELRTPLQSIQGFAELIEPQMPPGKLARYLEIIQHDTARLAAVVDDLSLLSEFHSGALKLYEEVLYVEEWALELVEAAKERYPGCSVTWKAQVDELPPVYADEERLRQILWMLLSNAVDAVRGKYGSASVILRPRWDGLLRPQLDFLFRDNHPQIPPKYRDSIFEPMPRLPRSLRRRPFGLGLHVARRLVRQMGGDLWLQTGRIRKTPSGRGKPRGNAFVVSVPIVELEW